MASTSAANVDVVFDSLMEADDSSDNGMSSDEEEYLNLVMEVVSGASSDEDIDPAAAVLDNQGSVSSDDSWEPQSPVRKRSKGPIVHEGFDDPDSRNVLPAFAPHRPVGIQLEQAFTRGMHREIEFFRLFFTREMLQEVVTHTNSYAHIKTAQKPSSYTNKEGVWTPTNLEEIERLIAFLVYAGLVKVDGDIENYWSIKTLYHGLWAREIISRLRYKSLMAFLHVVDPVTEDPSNKLRKVESFVQSFRERCEQLYQPSQNIAVDERMVKSRNRSGIRQFMKDKPTKWGIKLWVAADSSNGYTCNFEIYTGKKATGSSEHGLGYDVVIRLLDKYFDQGYHVYFDNFYTSHQLVRNLFLHGTPSTGTVRINRVGFPQCLKDVKA
ncbi:piggyBac transposable element-derived protein 4-like [Dendronephthya gigantea]|uniref:piggyBac transposable element-derived protein 4-like n=1 Tax=Dendronephthya gigantea TaxID=151771 RepID=UPI001069889E|nr:piggyBac transposable element-derived protein 4-like [Dendronephthya gigantea]